MEILFIWNNVLGFFQVNEQIYSDPSCQIFLRFFLLINRSSRLPLGNILHLKIKYGQFYLSMSGKDLSGLVLSVFFCGPLPLWFGDRPWQVVLPCSLG